MVRTIQKPNFLPFENRNSKVRFSSPHCIWIVKCFFFVVQVDVDVVSDDEEMFPSIGPYQCEICQNITDTKQVNPGTNWHQTGKSGHQLNTIQLEFWTLE